MYNKVKVLAITILFKVSAAFLKFISFFFYKKTTNILFVPESACKSNCLDIINYSADNLLSFLNYLLRNYNGIMLTIHLVCYNKNRILEYEKYVKSFHNKNLQIKYIPYNGEASFKQPIKSLKNTYQFYLTFLKCRYIFTSDALMRFSYKLKKQTYISLNYFTPFKLDTPKIDKNTSIEYVVSTSKLSSQIVSTSAKVPIENFLNLGFSRNDNILTPRFSREKLIDMLEVSYKIDKIITYSPTHRDYERGKSTLRNILGYDGSYEDLENILKKHSAILIIKLHPGHNMDCIEIVDNFRIFIYKPNYQYNLYDIYAHTDLLITDYTSAYFDFLLTDKPVIFNFYDKEIYEKTRGFSYDPVESICAGPIVKKKDDFLISIEEALSGKDEYKNHRNFINTLMNKYSDGDSSKRILNFFKTKLIK